MTYAKDSYGFSGEGAWSLTHILQVLYRRWHLFIMLPVIFAVGLGWGSSFLAKQYETKVVLELGHFQQDGKTQYV